MYLEIEPARAKSNAKKVEDAWDNYEWVCEEKIDGWRFLMHLGNNLDRVYMTGRRVSVVTGRLSEKGTLVPQIWPEHRNSVGYTVLDGEVTVPSGFRDIAGVMNTDPEKAAERIASIGTPTYNVFDVLFYDGVDVRNESLLDRRQILEGMSRIITGNLALVAQGAALRSTYRDVVARGGEGVMLKNLMCEYGDGWLKVKKCYTIEVVIMGFTDARIGRTGKYYGQIGAIVVGVWSGGSLVEVGQVSGMTDDERLEITNDRDKWMGKVIEIESQEFAKSRLRHPRYSRRRDDIDPRHATLAKMMADLGGMDTRQQLDLPL